MIARGGTIKVGFIGAGNICRERHLPNLRAMDEVDLVAVCNRSEASGRAIAEEFGISDVMTDWRQLVERDDIDAVFIGTYPYMHKDMSIAALQADKHVFCQARMAMDWEEALAMYDMASRKKHLVNMICPPPHRMPWEPAIKSMLANGELGELQSVSVVSADASCVNPDAMTWREQIEYSGLQVLQMGIIAETLNAWVGEYQTLTATTSIRIHEKRNGDHVEQIEIPQVVHISGELLSGVPIIERHTGLAEHEHENSITLYGSKGTLRVDMMKAISFGKKGDVLKPCNVANHLLWEWQAEREFIDAVTAANNGEMWQVTPDFREGLRYMRKVQAVHDSAMAGQMIDMDMAFQMPV